ncbi:Rieske (2Fe-2S) protein [Caballeronia sp.]|uniref:Rieske (2Fe-2S) protein n=1 Tax=Caballeronia sp. TaxID=1931223 RepID=UPI003C6F493B
MSSHCPHNGALLASGQLEGRVLRCPAHGMRFDSRITTSGIGAVSEETSRSRA